MSRKGLEEKRRKDEMEAAHVFEEFIETFQTSATNPVSKIWIKAEKNETNSGILYKPISKFKTLHEKSSMEHAQECARILTTTNRKSKPDTANQKKKSNLELFKEELELLHKDREEKQKQKQQQELKTENECVAANETETNTTTNLYVNNLHSKVTEQHLVALFGHYGPLASVKIMWPRTEEERTRSRNRGFVAFMSRKDAGRALHNLNGSILMGCVLKLGWGKTVLLPTQPVFIPESMLNLCQAPPVSGLPFNAQPSKLFSGSGTLNACVVKVVIPTEKSILTLIHRMIEFVIREGSVFESIIMSREINNPKFQFLFDNQSSTHIYYRWKLYSILQGDSVKNWSKNEFRMFENGSIWTPPTQIDYKQGMPEQLTKHLIETNQSLSKRQRNCLELLIHKLTPERNKIAEVLVFCLDHSEACNEIVECVTESLGNKRSSIWKIIARMYLISDILCNVSNVSLFKNVFENYLPVIMKNMSAVYEYVANEHKQIFFVRITRMLNAWLVHKVFKIEYLDSLYKVFINLDHLNDPNEQASSEKNDPITINIEEEKIQKSRFITSKWETVDPDLIESEAITTGNWFRLEQSQSEANADNLKIESNRNDKRRAKLREIEIKVMKYQDDLETDNSASVLIREKVEKYREMLMDQFRENGEGSRKRKRRKKRERGEISKKKSKY